MKHFFKFCRDHISLILISGTFCLVAVVNTVFYIGLFMDLPAKFFQTLHFYNILSSGQDIFKYHLMERYFPTMLSQFSVLLSIILNVTNVKYLLSVFTFVTYIAPVIFLIILYLNIPKNKKNVFDIIILFFLISVSYMKYEILSESLFASLFLWTIFVIFYYADFKKLSLINLISLIIFSIFLIESHPNVVFFIPLFLYLAVSKYLKTESIPFYSKNILIASFFILTVAFIFNIKCILNPIVPYSDYLNFNMLKNFKFILFVFFALCAFPLSFYKIGNDKIQKILLAIISFIILFTAINITPVEGIKYRMINIYSVLFSVFILIGIDFFNLKPKYLYIKVINVILLFALVISTFVYADKNNQFNRQLVGYIVNNHEIRIEKFERNNLKNKYDIYSALLFKNIFFQNGPNFRIKAEGKYHTKYLNDNEKLKKFGISRDDIYKLN